MKFYKLLLTICLFGFLCTGFYKRNSNSDPDCTEKYVTLDKQPVKLNANKRVTVISGFGETDISTKGYCRISDNPQMAKVS